MLGRAAAIAAEAIRDASAELTEEECTHICGAPPRRIADFSTGRLAAHRALAALGAGPCSIGVGGNREPLWPAGFTGSIAHGCGIAVALVGHVADFAGLGIDIEESGSIDREIWPMILTPDERQWVEALGSDADAAATRIFSMKEAIFKAQWYPSRRVPDFCDVALTPFSANAEGRATLAGGKVDGELLADMRLVHRRVGGIDLSIAQLPATLLVGACRAEAIPA